MRGVRAKGARMPLSPPPLGGNLAARAQHGSTRAERGSPHGCECLAIARRGAQSPAAHAPVTGSTSTVTYIWGPRSGFGAFGRSNVAAHPAACRGSMRAGAIVLLVSRSGVGTRGSCPEVASGTAGSVARADVTPAVRWLLSVRVSRPAVSTRGVERRIPLRVVAGGRPGRPRGACACHISTKLPPKVAGQFFSRLPPLREPTCDSGFGKA